MLPGACSFVGFCVGLLSKILLILSNYLSISTLKRGANNSNLTKKLELKFFRAVSSMKDTIWGWNDEDLDDDIVVDVNSIDNKPC